MLRNRTLPNFEYQSVQKAYSLTSLNNSPSKCMVDMTPCHTDQATKHFNCKPFYVNSG